MLLQGKTAVITGGTRGIGFAIARLYLENGAKVAIAGSRQETVDKALAQLTEYEGKVMGICPDLCDPEAVSAAFASVKEKFGSLDILVNNAGVSSRASLYDYSAEEFTRVMNLNVNAVFVCCQAAARIMKPQGGGVILNTSSMVAKDQIRVNAVAPGVTRTDMVAALPPEMVARVSAGIPLGRVGEPQDVANAFLYLASDMGSYVTGAVLGVDGGSVA